MLNPAAEQSNRIGQLWWIFCIVMSVIYALVLFFTVLAVARRNREITPPNLAPDPERERNLIIAVSGLVGVTVIILFYFMVRDFTTGRENRAIERSESAENFDHRASMVVGSAIRK